MAQKSRHSLSMLLPFFLAAVSRVDGVQQSHQQRALGLSSCASDCIQDSGCDLSDVGCMCKASRGTFLSDVVNCVYSDCSQPIAVDTWLDPLEFACNILGQPIPQSAISSAEAAERSATGYPDPTTATTTVVVSETTSVESATTSKTTYAATSKATTTARSTVTSTCTATSTKPSSQTESETSGSSTSLHITTFTSKSTTSASSTTDTPSSFATSSQTQLDSVSTTTSAYAGDPTDSSPFASPINSSSAHQRSSLFAAMMGLAAAMAFGW